MTLEELLLHYNNRVSEMCRRVDITRTSVERWKRNGYVPYQSQQKIEAVTNGALKANFRDDHRYKDF